MRYLPVGVQAWQIFRPAQHSPDPISMQPPNTPKSPPTPPPNKHPRAKVAAGYVLAAATGLALRVFFCSFAFPFSISYKVPLAMARLLGGDYLFGVSVLHGILLLAPLALLAVVHLSMSIVKHVRNIPPPKAAPATKQTEQLKPAGVEQERFDAVQRQVAELEKVLCGDVNFSKYDAVTNSIERLKAKINLTEISNLPQYIRDNMDNTFAVPLANAVQSVLGADSADLSDPAILDNVKLAIAEELYALSKYNVLARTALEAFLPAADSFASDQDPVLLTEEWDGIDLLRTIYNPAERNNAKAAALDILMRSLVLDRANLLQQLEEARAKIAEPEGAAGGSSSTDNSDALDNLKQKVDLLKEMVLGKWINTSVIEAPFCGLRELINGLWGNNPVIPADEKADSLLTLLNHIERNFDEGFCAGIFEDELRSAVAGAMGGQDSATDINTIRLAIAQMLYARSSSTIFASVALEAFLPSVPSELGLPDQADIEWKFDESDGGEELLNCLYTPTADPSARLTALYTLKYSLSEDRGHMMNAWRLAEYQNGELETKLAKDSARPAGIDQAAVDVERRRANDAEKALAAERAKPAGEDPALQGAQKIIDGLKRELSDAKLENTRIELQARQNMDRLTSELQGLQDNLPSPQDVDALQKANQKIADLQAELAPLKKAAEDAARAANDVFQRVRDLFTIVTKQDSPKALILTGLEIWRIWDECTASGADIPMGNVKPLLQGVMLRNLNEVDAGNFDKITKQAIVLLLKEIKFDDEKEETTRQRLISKYSVMEQDSAQAAAAAPPPPPPSTPAEQIAEKVRWLGGDPVANNPTASVLLGLEIWGIWDDCTERGEALPDAEQKPNIQAMLINQLETADKADFTQDQRDAILAWLLGNSFPGQETQVGELVNKYE